MTVSMRMSGTTRLPDLDPWRDIPRPGAAGTLRMAPVVDALSIPGVSINWARAADGRRLLAMVLEGREWPPLRKPHPAGLSLDEGSFGPNQTLVTLRLLDDTHGDLFASLCRDIITAIGDAADAGGARIALVSRTSSWQDLLRRSTMPALTREEQIGLLGELEVLLGVLAPLLGPVRALASWTGPIGGAKDFEVGDVWIDAKAHGAARKRGVHISSEAQLDDAGSRALFLHILPVMANADTASGGMTLPEWIAQARARLIEVDPSAGADFDGRIAAAGFDPLHEYEEVWLPGEPVTYRVMSDFPRIIASDFPPRPTAVSYDLPLSACEAWRAPDGAIQSEISGTP